MLQLNIQGNEVRHEVRFWAKPGSLIPNTSVGSKEKNTHDPFYYRLIVTVFKYTEKW